jgi:hypothetical protein
MFVRRKRNVVDSQWNRFKFRAFARNHSHEDAASIW